MRALEFLREYSRDITAKNLGQKLIDAALKDNSSIDLDLSEEPSLEDVSTILAFIETRDPTKNKQYTQWLARMYARGDVKIEDLNRGDILRLYDLGKRRGMIRPEHADINRFKSYDDFEIMIRDTYDLDSIERGPEKDKLEKGNADTILDTPEVRVIHPQDTAAACYYGQGTKWCTASTRGENYFDRYNRGGPMYILLPKQPEYEGEKYQLHFASDQFMNEEDSQVSLLNLLNKRFPSTREYFLKNHPELQEYVVFAPDKTIQSILNQIKELCGDWLWDHISRWQDQDDSFIEWQMSAAEERGYVDADGKVDWDRVHGDDELNDYMEYNYEAERYVKHIQRALDISASQAKDVAADMQENESEEYSLDHLDAVVEGILKEELPRDESEEICKWIHKYILIRRVSGKRTTWKAEALSIGTWRGSKAK